MSGRARRRQRVGTARVACVLAASGAGACLAATIADARVDRPARRAAPAQVSFEANRGQAARSVRFLARAPGSTLFLTRSEAVLGLHPSPSSPRAGVVRLRFAGASPHPRITAQRRLPGIVNDLTGDRARWRTGVPTYARVRYRRLWPGIDAVFHADQRRLEYDFVVAEGADPGAIALDVRGARARVDRRGGLVLAVSGGSVRQPRPVAYQDVDGTRSSVTVSYTVAAGGRVRLRVGRYDHRRRLVVDPILSYSTYLGGNAWDWSAGLAIDAGGSAYVTGDTLSTDFPTASPRQPAPGAGAYDVVVSKLDPTGNTLVYSTYLGGSGNDHGQAIAVDAGGNAYVTGSTASPNFPVVNARQPAPAGGPSDAFVAKLDATGGALTYSTYHGGDGADEPRGIAVDAAGNAYLAGYTDSSNFPTAGALQSSRVFGGPDAFVSKLNSSGGALTYSTYLGGNGDDRAAAIAVDAAGSAYITGTTISQNFPVVGAFQPALAGPHTDAFVTKLDPAGSGLSYSTYLGGNLDDEGSAIAVDGAGSAYVTGSAESFGFPTVNAFQAQRSFADSDAFVTKLDPRGDALRYSTYLGAYTPVPPGLSISASHGAAIAVDAAGGAVVAGSTTVPSFPIANAFQPLIGGDEDVFVTRFAPAGDTLAYSTYLGGSEDDWASSVAADGAGGAFVSGFTRSYDFPTRNPLQATHADTASDIFVTKIDGSDVTPPETVVLSGPPELVSSGDAALSFSSSEPGPAARYECRLDEGSFAACSSPVSYRGLAQGSHSFQVRAVDAYNNADPTPAAHAWTYDDTAPVAVLTSAPNPALADRPVTFDASASSDVGSTIVRYEWDLDGDGAFERDTGASATTTTAYAEPRTVSVQVRATDRAGLAGVARTDQRISRDTSVRDVATVTIDGEAVYTNDPRVTITATWPSFASQMLISNDGGFTRAQAFALQPRTSWILESSGADRLPRIVYVRFVRGLTVSATYTDDIILDERRPIVTSARVPPAKGSGPPLLRVVARDRGLSGVAGVQVTNNRRLPGARFRAYHATIALNRRRGERPLSVRKRIYVRVRDHAGNLSAWRLATLPRRGRRTGNA